MSVLALDPGAKRLGWAILHVKTDGSPACWDSGVVLCERRDGESYQDYRLRAMENGIQWLKGTLDWYSPDEVVSEILPVKGFNDMGQAYLALSVVSAILGCCYGRPHPTPKISQIGATTVKAKIGGSNKATKVRVRNGVWQLIPDLQKKATEWKGVYDESDAVAIGLTHLGFTRPK